MEPLASLLAGEHVVNDGAVVVVLELVELRPGVVLGVGELGEGWASLVLFGEAGHLGGDDMDVGVAGELGVLGNGRLLLGRFLAEGEQRIGRLAD